MNRTTVLAVVAASGIDRDAFLARVVPRAPRRSCRGCRGLLDSAPR